ncbi:MAG: hypothetical protein ACXVJN_17700 [Mucilaginibacter sp.]
MFNFFKRTNNNGQPLNGETVSTQRPPVSSSFPDIDEQVFIEPVNKATSSSNRFTNSEPPSPAVTDHNIDLLYAFLDRNYEGKGYDDALLNPDSSHLSQNLDVIKNDLIRTINKVKIFYEDFIQETDYHIVSRSRSGMVDTVEELEMKKKIALRHMDRIKEIEKNTIQNEGDCQGILMSYTRGFKNGLAAISHHHILTRRF